MIVAACDSTQRRCVSCIAAVIACVCGAGRAIGSARGAARPDRALAEATRGIGRSRSEAADALRQSERAISDANRRLFQLAGQRREGKAVWPGWRRKRRAQRKARRSQQALLGKLVYQQYLSGQPEPLRLLLNRQDPNEIARQMYYLGYVSRARADLIASLRHDFS